MSETNDPIELDRDPVWVLTSAIVQCLCGSGTRKVTDPYVPDKADFDAVKIMRRLRRELM